MRGQGQQVRPDTLYGEAPERICFMDPQLRLLHDHLAWTLAAAGCSPHLIPCPAESWSAHSSFLAFCL